MNRRFILSLLAAAALFPATIPTRADATILPDAPQTEGYMARARSFTDMQLFNAVADQLQRISTEGSPLTADQRREFLFMLGNAYSRTDNPQCLELLDEFIRKYPAAGDAVAARLAKADFLFFAHDYPEALSAYNAVDFSRIEPAMLPEARYRKAFSLVKCGFFDEARPLLAALHNNKEYARAARFTDAYCDYMTGDYDSAYDKFTRLADTRQYPRTHDADYYLAQILYRRGEFSEAAAMAEEALSESPAPALESETRRVLGMALFKAHDTDAAFPELKKYVADEGDKAAADARYALASIYYDRGDNAQAAPLLEPLLSLDDAIGQGALLTMGQIAADEGDENAASIYFDKASRMGFDRDVSRKALYNYVAARTRGGRIPFAPQIDLLERFIREYPSSDRTPAVREYLATAYFHEKDYARALQSIEGIRNPSAKVLSDKQKILYELGVQSLQNGRSPQATDYLRQAAALGNAAPGLLPDIRLWLGDALYAEKKYSQAQEAYAKAAGQLKGANRSLALYGQAYSLFQNDKFPQALKLFTQAADDRNLPERLRADARIRRADCLFYTGDHEGARRLYSSLSADGLTDADYSAWRHAELTGVMGDVKEKIAELEKLRQTASPRWMPDILTSLGEAYAADGRQDKAEGVFSIILRDYSSSRSAPRAALSLAESYARAGRDSQAESQYLKLLRTWPSSQEAAVADRELRRIFAADDRLAEYAEILKEIPGNFTLGQNEMESLTFDTAADAFNADETDYARLEKYLEQFPSGANSSEALYMLARGKEADGDKAGAYKAWRQLELRSDSEYLNEAYAGLMRTAPDASTRLKYARRVADAPGVSAEQRADASLIQAQALADSGKADQAVKIWTDLGHQPAALSGAKAAVALGDYYLKTRKYQKAENVLTDFIDSGTPHSYWLARAYITLADVYTAQGKSYLAKQYLESLRDNYPGKEADIRKMINSRLSRM